MEISIPLPNALLRQDPNQRRVSLQRGFSFPGPQRTCFLCWWTSGISSLGAPLESSPSIAALAFSYLNVLPPIPTQKSPSMEVILNSPRRGHVLTKKEPGGRGNRTVFRADGRGKGWRGWGGAGKRGFDSKERGDDKAPRTEGASTDQTGSPMSTLKAPWVWHRRPARSPLLPTWLGPRKGQLLP